MHILHPSMKEGGLSRAAEDMFQGMDLEDKSSPVLVVHKTREDMLKVVDKTWEDMKVVDKLEGKQLVEEEEDKLLVDMLLNEAGMQDMEMVFDKLLLVDKKLHVVEEQST